MKMCSDGEEGQSFLRFEYYNNFKCFRSTFVNMLFGQELKPSAKNVLNEGSLNDLLGLSFSCQMISLRCDKAS